MNEQPLTLKRMKTMKKIFEVKIDVTSQTWETCYAYVEAETAEEAETLFHDDPTEYDWDGWEHQDSEVQHWEVDSIEYDEFMTNRMKEKNGEEV